MSRVDTKYLELLRTPYREATRLLLLDIVHTRATEQSGSIYLASSRSNKNAVVKIPVEMRIPCYISNLLRDAERHLLKTIHSHCGIEARLHWVLDLDFRED